MNKPKDPRIDRITQYDVGQLLNLSLFGVNEKVRNHASKVLGILRSRLKNSQKKRQKLSLAESMDARVEKANESLRKQGKIRTKPSWDKETWEKMRESANNRLRARDKIK